MKSTTKRVSQPKLSSLQIEQCAIYNVEVKESTLPNAGFGLFTTIDRKKNDLIVTYDGTVIEVSHDQLPPEGPYVFQMSNQIFIDSIDPHAGLGRFVNCCRPKDEITTGLHNNAVYRVDQARRAINVRATQKISAGDEIFAPYGKKYRWWP